MYLGAAVVVLCGALLRRLLCALLLVPALFYRDVVALLFDGPVGRGGVVRRLRGLALQLVLGPTLLLVATLVFVDGFAVGVGHLLAVVVVQGAALLPGN